MGKHLAGILKCVLSLAILVTLTFEGRGQSTYGTIQGTVLDSSGSAVDNAAVTLKNEQTGTTQTSHTNGSGNYRFFDLNAGIYQVTIDASGFTEQTISHQNLLARQILNLDASLSVGAARTEEVTVNEAASLLSDDPTVSSSRTHEDVNQLALNFRATDNNTPIYVATLTPAVQSDNSGNISVSGGMPYQTSYSIDGVNTTNVRYNGPNTNLFPSVESIAEFKVNTANNDAEFGQPSDITVTSRSGANQFHGAAYEFFQNAALDARNPFQATKGKLTANDFGGYFGGPLTVPHFYNAKDKTFFFVDYEGTRRPEATAIAESVPSDAFRSGDLSAIPTAIINPATGAPFPNNQIPVTPTSASLLNSLYVHANAPGIANNYFENFGGNYTLNNVDVRVDENFTANQKLFVRIGGRNVDLTGTDGSGEWNTLNGAYVNNNRVRNGVASYDWIITPAIVNEFRAGYTVSDFYTGYPLAGDGAAILAAAGIVGTPAAPASGGTPDISFSDGSFIPTNSSGRPRSLKNLTYEFTDNLSYAVGKHSFKFGVDYTHMYFRDYLTFTTGDQFGDYSFSGQVTGNAFADFLLGYPSATDYSVDGPDAEPYSHTWGFYAQDSWKLTPHLTINYGLRYEIHPPFDDHTKQLANFDRSIPGGEVIVQGQQGLSQVLPIFQQSIGSTPIVTNTQAGLPGTLRNTYYGDIDPRIGFTWSPAANNKTVIKSGFGIYTVPVLGSILYSLAGVATSNYLLFQQNGNLVFPNVFPTGSGGAGASLPDFRRANQIDLKEPRELQWNFQLEQAIGFQSVLRLSYTGSHTTNLVQSPDLNQVPANTIGYEAYRSTFGVPFPNFNAVLSRDNALGSKYNAFTTEVERRYAAGITLNGNYTWQKDISNALGSVPGAFSAENGPTTLDRFGINNDFGDVSFDRRHRFVGTFLYELPFGRGKRFAGSAGRGLNLLIGGWSVAGIQIWQSGPFLTPSFSGTDPSGTGVLVRGVTTAQRPDCTGIDPNTGSQSLNGYWNTGFYDIPGNNIGRFGNCGVGILHGPGTVSFSGTAGKSFAITERVALRYEAQFANLFNHPNYAPPSTNVSSASFGTITNVQDASTNYGNQAGPRTIQMTLRLSF